MILNYVSSSLFVCNKLCDSGKQDTGPFAQINSENAKQNTKSNAQESESQKDEASGNGKWDSDNSTYKKFAANEKST